MVDAPQTVTQGQFASRMRALLPDGWFPSGPATGETEQAPVLNSMLQGFGSVFKFIWGLLTYIYPQQRLATATGPMLDMFAQDFFGTSLPRLSGESDDDYRARIKSELMPVRFIREAIETAISESWSDPWALVEPRNANDTKGMASMDAPAVGGGYGYGSKMTIQGGNIAANGTPCLRYGSELTPFQGFVLLQNGPTDGAPTAVADAIEKVRAGGVVFWICGSKDDSPFGDFGKDVL